ncbi:MAG: extracellular solute-binding protein [Lachnospiraceae bacterium]|nr:extracellular solute-binding protein [Lachnospiraceae bacterium]
MKLKKLTALAMTTAMCAATVFGCGSSEDGSKETTTGSGASEENPIKAEIKVWSPQEDQTSGWIQQECENFSKAHPEWDITFTYEVCGEGDAKTNVVADVEAAGDVYFFANDQLTTLLNAEAIAKFGGTVVDDIKATNSETLVNSVTIDGNIYGIPFTANTWFLYYDKSVYSEDDVKSLDTMLEKGVVAFPVTNTWYTASLYAAAGATFSGAAGNDESAGTELGDKAAKVTDYIIDLYANANFRDLEAPDAIKGFADGTVAACMGGTWNYEDVKAALGDNIGIAQLPAINIDGTDCVLKSFAGSKCIGVNPRTEYPEIATALAKYLAGKDAQQSHYEMRNIIPCNTELLEVDVIKSDALVKAQGDTIANTSIVQPLDSKFNDNYWDAAGAIIAEIKAGTCTKDNSAEKTQAFEDACNGNN